MGSFSLIHWLILGLFILLLFGGNRFSSMMKDVAKGMKSFKEGLADDDEKNVEQRRQESRQLPPQSRAPEQPIEVTPEPRPSETPPSDDSRRG